MKSRAQLELPVRTWGGKRAGSGRKALPERKGMIAHLRRPSHDARHPVHVTMRAVPRQLNLRAELVFRRVRRCIARSHRGGLRITHFSVQRDHVHLIVEAPDRRGMARGLQGVASGIARAVNRMGGRSGRFWRDRYHRHDLVTPREVRNAIVYVTMNVRKHVTRDPAVRRALDPCSSAAWLGGWDPRAGPWLASLRAATLVRELTPDDPPVAPSDTWLGTVGWKRHGLIAPEELPSTA